MPTGHDPRVYFAAERTLRAWIRTGLAIIGLGFVVARFGMFLALGNRAMADAPGHHVGSTAIGVVLILLGSIGVGVSAMQHLRFCRNMVGDQRPRDYWLGLSLWSAFILTAVGIALAGYLVWQISVVQTSGGMDPIAG
jgi:putative membrane protein